MSVYRKWGRTVRVENGVVVRVEEAGEAVEEGGEFVVRPIAERRELPEVRISNFEFRNERLLAVEGAAIHEVNGVTWTEHTRRLHLSIAQPPFRMLIDQASFDVDAALLETFARIGGWREAPRRLLLAPRVAATVLHALPIARAQRAGEHPDGYGQPVETRAVEGEPPNWWRPSYRVRPVRAWFNLAALPFGRLDDAAPRAVARLGDEDVLVVDGSEVYAAPLRPGRVLAVGAAAEWFPYGAGVWGADMLLESAS
jgi:hypothetical protein